MGLLTKFILTPSSQVSSFLAPRDIVVLFAVETCAESLFRQTELSSLRYVNTPTQVTPSTQDNRMHHGGSKGGGNTLLQSYLINLTCNIMFLHIRSPNIHLIYKVPSSLLHQMPQIIKDASLHAFSIRPLPNLKYGIL